MLAAENACFLQAFVKIGLLPDSGGTWFLPQRIGVARAMGLAMLGEKLDAKTALAWGLIDKLAPEGGLDAEIEHLVDALLECGPEALRSQKALLRQWEELPLTESVDLSVKVFGESFLTDEPTRLMQAFVNRKR